MDSFGRRGDRGEFWVARRRENERADDFVVDVQGYWRSGESVGQGFAYAFAVAVLRQVLSPVSIAVFRLLLLTAILLDRSQR